MPPNTDALVQSKKAFFFAIFLFFCLISGLATGTILKPQKVPDLTREADLIAVVRVEGHQSLRAGSRNFIYTDHTVHIEEVVHKRPNLNTPRVGEKAVLRQIGGRIGDVQQSVVGTEDIRQGDRWVVFVRLHEGRIYLIGMHQGGWFIDGSNNIRPSRSLRDVNTPDTAHLTKDAFIKNVRSLAIQVRP